uniref:glycosyltransferase family 2 protein n=1 Tax=uncultured Sphingomonas sp. TaxID=158754 RepID=UPI0025CCA6A6|nr:glycosyltransferase family 2 protein [uncultured Sphingomonas sp.]
MNAFVDAATFALPENHGNAVELSVVLPCLNEAETLVAVIDRARRFLAAYNVAGEIVVADNGSTDGSIELAQAAGARVIHISDRGYGAALIGGIRGARGTFVAMGDADESYDFMELMPFLERLRSGTDLVMGNRFLGGIGRGAMPPLHRYLGNPVLSWAGRLLYRASIGDFHCGLRAFRRDAILGLRLNTTGMEFASEMVVKANLQGLAIAEVPTTLKKDGRSRPPHLRSWRDGWRHLKFLLTFSPRWLFVYPGTTLVVASLLTFLLLLPGQRTLGPVRFGVHSLLFAGFGVLTGLQLASLGLIASVHGARERYWAESNHLARLRRWLSVDRSCLAGGGLLVLGIAGATLSLLQWAAAGYGDLLVERQMRLVIPSLVLVGAGIQLMFTGFLLEFLGQPRTIAVTTDWDARHG